MSTLQKEIEKRKTFAIISHPDAGKTTLTEKFLLFGGAIQVAGAVKSNKIKKSATSDFMEIERQRGISVATSVMSFEYENTLVNLLDTPGHKDFAEDTYRTLTAVDSVVLVIDSVKGVETQTERLMEVCRMRNTPVIVFINKLDRDGRDAFELLDELEEKLQITTRPMSWPIGMGKNFKGVYNLYESKLNLFQPGQQKISDEVIEIEDLADPRIDQYLENYADELREEVELIEGVYDPFDLELYREGLQAPVFFGSALNNFGVRELLSAFVKIAPNPLPRQSDKREVAPDEAKFSGFVFKIHANIDPNHRNRIAFLRICSGKFERNKFFYHTRLDKNLRFNTPYSFLARSKEILEEAYPGDIIGLYDAGYFKIGDTLTEGEKLQFKGIPSFSPERFKEVLNDDPLKTKQLDKGLKQLSEEGVAQLFIQDTARRKIIGTVGELQFEVIKYRLKEEYGASCTFKPIAFHKACWVTSDNPEALRHFLKRKADYIASDTHGYPVFLAESQWILKVTQEDYPEIQFHNTSEFKVESEKLH